MVDEHVVVAGAGLVAATLARELRRADYNGRITLLGDEPHAPYDRPPLSKQLLAGSLSPEDAALFRPGEPEQLGVELMLGSPAVSLDLAASSVNTADGGVHHYTTAVLATGARSRRLDGIGGLPGVHYLRSLDESLRLAADLRASTHLVIVGAGFIGLEVAAVASGLGCHVTVIEAASRPLARVLSTEAGELVAEMHRQHGVELRCSAAVSGVVGDGRVEAVMVDGHRLHADLLLIGVGATPNTEWLLDSGIVVEDGVVCDSSGRTNVAGVFAAGDVSRWRNACTGEHRRVEQWQSAVDQARVVASVIARPDKKHAWDSVPYFWSDQYDHKLQMCGSPGPLLYRRECARGTVVCFGRDERLCGVLTVSNPRALAQGRRLVGEPWAKALAWAGALN